MHALALLSVTPSVLYRRLSQFPPQSPNRLAGVRSQHIGLRRYEAGFFCYARAHMQRAVLDPRDERVVLDLEYVGPG